MNLTGTALTSTLLAALAGAQSPTLVARVGDAVPGAGLITDIDEVHVHTSGTWFTKLTTDDPVAHTVLYGPFGADVKTGDSPVGLGGGTVSAIGSSTNDLFGIPTWIADVSGAPFGQALMYGYWSQFLSGALTANFTNQFPAGSTWRRFDDLQFSSTNPAYLFRGAIDDPGSGALDLSFAALTWHCGSLGVICYVDLVALEGQLAPGLSRVIEEVRGGPARARVDRSGELVVWSCDLEGAPADDGCVYLTQGGTPSQVTLLAREGSPSPVPGRTWGPLEDIAVDVNSLGNWTLRAQLDPSDPASDEVLVVDGAVFAREGEPHPAIGAHPIGSLGSGPGLVDQNGRVLWFAGWDDASTPGQDEALIHDDIVLVRTGSTTVGGAVLVDIESTPGSYALETEQGRFLLFTGTLSDGTRGLFRLDQGAMTTYCTAKLNSAGCSPVMFWSGQPPSQSSGSGFVINSLFLLAQQRALLLYGTDGPLAAPFHGGLLCVNPPLRRMPPLNTGGSAGCSGKLEVDFNAWIASGADPSLVPGQRVHVQAWYRDPGFAPPDGVGLTNALEFVVGP